MHKIEAELSIKHWNPFLKKRRNRSFYLWKRYCIKDDILLTTIFYCTNYSFYSISYMNSKINEVSDRIIEFMLD